MVPLGDKQSAAIRLLLCLAVAIGPALSMFGASASSLSAGAQTRARKTPASGSPKRQKSSVRATASPTPSWIDRLGEPPPAPPAPASKAEQEIAPGDVISVETTEVMLPVTVRDDKGRLVSALARDDFRVFEDNHEQPLRDLALRQVPVDAILMVDTSSSTARNLDDFRRAAEGFAQRLGSDDRISLIKFDDSVQLLQNWTKSRFQLQRALTRIVPGMFTRFNDALLLAAREQYGSSGSRRAVIVLTDGIDSGRGTTLENAARALLEAQVTVYVVSNTEISRAAKLADLDSLTRGTDASQRFNKLQIDDLKMGLQALDQSEQMLAQLTEATGGRLYKPKNFDALEATYAEVAEELRHQYALYYTPQNKTRDGGFRRVRVEATNPSYQTHTRIGYFAPKT
ncbi:MAG TPA: VWA domain-containing protein [Pyrinomonadaceae bacterium]|nr:VWA domain-containing protein [Pyrinomonadaceae bacterium]